MRGIRLLFVAILAALVIGASSVSAQENVTILFGLDEPSLRRIFAGECVELPNSPEVKEAVKEAWQGLKDYIPLMKNIQEQERTIAIDKAMLQILSSTPPIVDYGTILEAELELKRLEAELRVLRLDAAFSGPDTGVLFILLANCLFEVGRALDGIIF